MKKFLLCLTCAVVFFLILTGIAAVSAYHTNRMPSDSIPANGILAVSADSVSLSGGEVSLSGEAAVPSAGYDDAVSETVGIGGTNANSAYVLNTSSKKIHKSSCSSVSQIKDSNKAYTDDYAQAEEDGFSPCQICFAEN
ncbi:MAG: hypothetical protein IJ325_03110 [Clostridia bacterium]|nr:hypothetical protein [Clostridia bacterium]